MSNVQLGYTQVIDPISFKSIPSGKIYIGEYGTLPNPANSATWKQAYFVQDDGSRVPASQPVRTNAAGFAVDSSGNIKTVQVDGQYSLLIQDGFGVQKYSNARVIDLAADLASTDPAKGAALVASSVQIVPNVAALRNIVPSMLRRIQTRGYYTDGDCGAAQYFPKVGAAPGTYVHNGGTVIVPNGGDGSTAWLLDLSVAYVTVEMFGCYGDAADDDKLKLQAAFDWSRTNRLPVYLSDKRYYTSGTLNAGGAIIRSISGRPGGADPVFRRKPDGTYVTGSPNWDYFYNSTTAGRAYTWAQMIADTSYGCAIISDFNGAILYAADTFQFDINGIAVIGNHRQPNQDGIATAVPSAYYGNAQRINNVSVIGCGRHGINLERGFEVSTMTGVNSSANNGYGLRTGRVSGIDSATEYLDFKDCSFTNNRLSGVYFSQWRKAIAFYNCGFNNSGQYDSPGGIDPLLGYDRTVPATAAAMAAGVWVNDVSLDDGSGYGFGFTMEGCFGELMAKGLHLRGQNGGGVCRDIRIENNVWYRATQVGTSVSGGGENGVGHYFDVKYVGDWLIAGNHSQALLNLKFASVPTRDNNSVVIIDENIPNSTAAEREFSRLQWNAPIRSAYYVRADGRVYGNQVISRDFGGLGANGNILISNIGTDFTVTSGQNLSNSVAVYSLTAHWQATNNNVFGAYLLFVTKMPSGQYIMTTIAAASVSGFTAVPTINTSTGELTIPAVALYRYTLQRLDNVLTNATP